ncbi:MAG TPA: prephenate dehydratase [Candidatus Pacearchaeota archaeon]|nr:prephenate dehydratase [Candidatus Pacearchaeota archaeon]HDZ60261.1 prephenate dehydratase [Candidatus Pacearchaeota archaeon]
MTKEIFKDKELISLNPIRNVIMAVENGKADYGIVPLENFYNGEVRETLDSLTECSQTKIIEEKVMTIVHCLGTLKNSKEIKKILSKDQALEQCSKYICENYPNVKTIATSSTAEAVENIKEKAMTDAGAIASEEALKSSGFNILDKDICPKNKTRFIVLSRKISEKTGDDKTFLVIHPPIDKSGILYNCLKTFSDSDINLELIQSRPNREKGYYFYIELSGHKEDERVTKAIEKLQEYLDPKEEYPNTIKILGSYPNSHWKE